MLADQDTRDSGHQGMQQEMVQVYSEFGAQTAFMEPEILKFEKGHDHSLRGQRAAPQAVCVLLE